MGLLELLMGLPVSHLTATGRHLIAIWDHTLLPATRHK